MDCLPTLKGERVSLRWLTEADKADVFALFGDPRVTQHMGITTRRDEADALALIEEIHACAQRDELYQWGVATHTDDRIIGTVTLAGIDLANRRAELGFAIAHAHWGCGYATQAVHIGLRHAFETMAMHRIEADVAPSNGASIAVLERHGFRKEGYMRQRWWNQGQWDDTVFFGLLAPEWPGHG